MAVAVGVDRGHVGAASPGRCGFVEQVGDRRYLVLTVLIDERAAVVIKALGRRHRTVDHLDAEPADQRALATGRIEDVRVCVLPSAVL